TRIQHTIACRFNTPWAWPKRMVNDRLPALAARVFLLLATGAGGPDSFPARVARDAAVPAGGADRRGSVRAAARADHAAGAGLAGTRLSFSPTGPSTPTAAPPGRG